MGRWSATAGLDAQFNDPHPRWVAEQEWRRSRPRPRDKDAWLAQHSWDVTSYEELFPYPRSSHGGPRWWARTIGDVHLTTLFVTQIWRTPLAHRPRKVSGGGRGPGGSAAVGVRAAHPRADQEGLPAVPLAAAGALLPGGAAGPLPVGDVQPSGARPGRDNSAPPFTGPAQTVHCDPASGAVTAVTYHYPLADDYILRDLEPLSRRPGSTWSTNGHSHLWNRFRNNAGVNWLETSNVGNSYGAYDASSGATRNLPDHPDYVRQGGPGGLEPSVPSVAPLTDSTGAPLPFLASTDITAFSLLDSAAGVVRSTGSTPAFPTRRWFSSTSFRSVSRVHGPGPACGR